MRHESYCAQELPVTLYPSLKRIPVVSSAGPIPIFYAFWKIEWDVLNILTGKVDFGLGEKKKKVCRISILANL